MEIHFTITPADILAFNRYCFRYLPIAKRNYWRGYLFLPVGLILTGAAFSMIMPSQQLWFTLFCFIIIWIFAYPLIFDRWVVYMVRRSLADGHNRGLLTAHTITIDEQGILEVTEVNESRWTWAGVERIEQTETYIFIFVGPALAHIIPKQAFSTSETATAFSTTAIAFFNQSRITDTHKM